MPGDSEFDLIRAQLAPHAGHRHDVLLGIGDDAALLAPPPGRILVASTDTLVEGVHFVADIDPRDLGHRALAVNLSDLAAMGAEPAWALLVLTLPAADAVWVAAFAGGFSSLARAHGVALVGGDLSAGPRAVAVTVLGSVPPGAALRRDGARPGERVCVSGELGAAAAALALGEVAPAPLAERLLRPEPRLALGRALRGVAGAVIDISDGLAADLGHVLAASGCGACLDLDAIPVASAAVQALGTERALEAALHGGDDYELAFTLPREVDVAALAAAGGVAVTEIGEVTAEPGLRARHGGRVAPLPAQGYRHFADP